MCKIFSAPYDPYEHADCSYHQKWYDASEYGIYDDAHKFHYLCAVHKGIHCVVSIKYRIVYSLR